MSNVNFTSLYRGEREWYIYILFYLFQNRFKINIINTSTEYQVVKSKISTQNQHRINTLVLKATL